MFRILAGAILASLIAANLSQAQDTDKQKLKSDGYGSISGKVTLVGKVPALVDLTAKMKANPDKECCLSGKEAEKIDQTWIVDPKTKAVKNVMVWVMPPKGTYFEIPFKLKRRKDIVILDQPHCAFTTRVAAFNPVYFDGKKMVPTGQQLIIKNSSTVPHNVRAIGNGKDNEGFNRNLPPKTELDVLKDLNAKQKLNPQLLPLPIQCDVHTWMGAKLFVFDHPYYALTKDDGTFEIPQVPAGAEIRLYAFHEGQGWVNSGFKAGQPITVEKGKTTTVNFEVKAPPAE